MTEETTAAVLQSVQDEGSTAFFRTWLDQMAADNPVLAREIADWSKNFDDPVKALFGPAMLYQFLRAQASADSALI